MSKTFDQLPTVTPLTGDESLPVNQTSQTKRATVDDFSTYLSTSLAGTFASSTHNHDNTYQPKNSNIQEHIVSTTNPHNTTASQVGLGNVTNHEQVKRSEMGQANGVATLDTGGKVPANQLPSTLMEYKGVWNALANSPALQDGEGSSGDVYRVTVAGTQFNPPISFEIGDYCVYNGTTWEKSDTTDSVPSVFGRTGPISAQTNDYNWGQIDKTTSSLQDIASRSHSLLTDVGTNSHATIDIALTKLGTIQEGAEVNVNPDWESTSGDSQILNKPLLNQDAGTASEPQFTDNLNGSCTIGQGVYNLYSTSDYTGPIKQYIIAGTTFTLTDNAMNYIVADYNGGSPIIRNTVNLSDINDSSVTPILSVFRVGNNLHNIDWDSLGKGLPNKLNRRDRVLRRFEIESGLTLSEAATRLVKTLAGTVWYGGVAMSLPSASSDVDHTHIWYHSSGAWTFTATTQYDNNNYDNGTNLTVLTANRYSVNWVFRGVYQGVSATNIVIGRGDYTLAQAISAPIPSLPPFVSTTNVLIGRIIVQKGATTATQIDQVQAVTLTQAQATSHEDLLGRDSLAQHPASSITNTPAGSISSTTVQAAIDELATEKAPLLSPQFTGSPYTPQLRVGEPTTYGWSGVSAVDVNTKGAVLGTTGAIGLSYNVYFDGTVYRYKTADTINQMYQSAAGMFFRTLASGNAGNTVGTWNNILGFGINGYNCSTFGTNVLLDTQNALQVKGGLLAYGATEDNQTIGSAVTSRIKILNTYAASFGRLSELQFAASGNTANQILACISSAYRAYDATNGTGGDLLFSTKYATTDVAPLERMRITQIGNVLIGTTTEDTAYKLYTLSSKTDASSYGITGNATMTLTTGAGYNMVGVYGQATGIAIPVGVTCSGFTAGLLARGYADTVNFAGTLQNSIGVKAEAGISSCTSGAVVTNAYGVMATMLGVSGGTITNAFGCYVDNSTTGGTITNRWGVYQVGASAKNYFQGRTLMGTTSDDGTNMLQVAGGATFGSGTQKVHFRSTGSGFAVNRNMETGAIFNSSNNAFQVSQNGTGNSAYLSTACYNMAGSLIGSYSLSGAGNLLVGTTTDDGVNKLQVVGPAKVAYGNLSLIVGADTGAYSTITNTTQKAARVVMPHYTNAEEPMMLFMGVSASTFNVVNIGGASNLANTATHIQFFTAANTTTTTGTEAARITPNQNLLVGTVSENTTTGNARIQSSNGVYLGNSANSAANVLDWYEEGTFTPVLSGETTAGTQTYAERTGRYTRIGRVVHISIRVQLSAKDAAMAGNVIITGLPWVVDSGATSQAGADIGFLQNVSYATTAGYTPTAYLKSGASAVYMMITKSGATAEYLQASTITATSDICLSATYTV